MKTTDLEKLLDSCFTAKRIIETLPELPKGMKPRHVHVLHAIYELQDLTEGCRVSDVSKKLNITMPSITKLVQELDEKKLLKKFIRPRDKRVTLLKLTEEGKLCVKKYVIEFHKEWSSNLQDISSEEIEHVIEIIKKLGNTMPGVK